jgi:hypothetical protein
MSVDDQKTTREDLLNELNKIENIDVANNMEDEFSFDCRLVEITSDKNVSSLDEVVNPSDKPSDTTPKGSKPSNPTHPSIGMDENQIKETKKIIIDSISDEIANKIKTKSCRQIPNTEKYFSPTQEFEKYLFSKTYVPPSLYHQFTMNNLIRNITSYAQYDSYGSPENTIRYDVPERCILIGGLNDIFNHTFMNIEKFDVSDFREFPKTLVSFINASNADTMKFEYYIITLFMSKLLICLNTVTELSYRDNSKSNINYTFKQAILEDLEVMSSMHNNKIKKSWNCFVQSLLSIGDEDNKLIYVHKDYDTLNSMLKQSYDIDYAVETLLGRCLKCYRREFIVNYFYIIESVYLMIRLIAVYKQKKLYEGKTDDDVIKDLHLISSVSVIIYENKVQSLCGMIRSLPDIKDKLSEYSKLYFINHHYVSGCYFLLKQLEHSIPILHKFIRG